MPYIGPRPKPKVMTSGDRIGDQVVSESGQDLSSRPVKAGYEETNIRAFSVQERVTDELDHVIEAQKPARVEVTMSNGDVMELVPSPETESCGETLSFFDPTRGVHVDIPKERCEVRDCG